MFTQIKVLFIIVALVGASGAIYYVKKLQHENEILILNQAKLETAVEEQKAVITQQKESYEKILASNVALNDKITEVNKAKNELQKKLAKHDMNFLAVEKPKLIERIINKGTMGVLDDIENLTK
jgi:3-polyprenyl-4-hydroxybenzoate decarboxylase